MDARLNLPGQLKSANEKLADLGPETLSRLVAASSDVAVIVDDEGKVRDLAVSGGDAPADVFEGWIGRPFTDTVTIESKPKVERLFARSEGGTSGPAQVNHTGPNGGNVPISYTAAELDQHWFLAVGRDLSMLAKAQTKLIEAQRAADRASQELHRSEVRFRQYYQVTEEPALFVDAADRIVDANRSAQARWDSVPRLTGRRIGDLLGSEERAALSEILEQSRTAGGTRTVVAGDEEILSVPVVGSPGMLLVRFVGQGQVPTGRDRLGRAVEMMPDGMVVTDNVFRIVTANRAFVDMIDAGVLERVEGSSLDLWLGRSGVDLSVIRAGLMESGTIRSYNTVLQSSLGQSRDVSVSACRVSDRSGELIGLSLRPADAVDRSFHTRSAQELSDLVGRVPIKDIVRETTETIERMCIEAALELSGDNRASAAELLGLSRQSLYVKMRRFGIVDAGDGNDGSSAD